MTRRATPEPEYRTVQKFDDFEVRVYSAYSVAEVSISGAANIAGNRAFNILAGYIFGKNKGDRKLAMGAVASQDAEPIQMKMMAPVIQVAAASGHLVQFVLPKGVTKDTAPVPLDTSIQLRDVAPDRVAVIRYSGFWSDKNYHHHLTKLKAGLRRARLSSMGAPVYSRYNAPFTLWFMRRNEIWLHLAAKK